MKSVVYPTPQCFAYPGDYHTNGAGLLGNDRMPEAKSVYTLLKELYLIIDDGDRRLLGDFDLTPPRYYALVHLGERPGISLGELSDLMICDKSNATRIVKGLVAEGLVIKKPNESDGRSIRLFLTDDGYELRERAVRAHQEYNKLRFANFEKIETEDLILTLDELKDALVQTIVCSSV